jgi:hypothetical protein
LSIFYASYKHRISSLVPEPAVTCSASYSTRQHFNTSSILRTVLPMVLRMISALTSPFLVAMQGYGDGKRRGIHGGHYYRYHESNRAGFAMMDLRSPYSDFRSTEVDGNPVEFDVFIEQNIVAMVKLNVSHFPQ